MGAHSALQYRGGRMAAHSSTGRQQCNRKWNLTERRSRLSAHGCATCPGSVFLLSGLHCDSPALACQTGSGACNTGRLRARTYACTTCANPSLGTLASGLAPWCVQAARAHTVCVRASVVGVALHSTQRGCLLPGFPWVAGRGHLWVRGGVSWGRACGFGWSAWEGTGRSSCRSVGCDKPAPKVAGKI